MKKQIGKNVEPNSYFDGIVTDHIYAFFKDGKLYHFDKKNEEVILKYNPKYFPDGIFVKMVVPLNFLPDTTYTKENLFQKEEKILDIGSILNFEIKYEREGAAKHYRIEVKLNKDLKILKSGQKLPKLCPCNCSVSKVVNTYNKSDIVTINNNDFNSLNQLFTQVSIQLRPLNRSHTCNVFTTFKLETGNDLDSLR
jgi:hypothetical protein